MKWLAIAYAVCSIIAFLASCYGNYILFFDQGLGDKLLPMLKANAFFWFLFAINLGWIGFRLYRNPDEFTWLEAIAQFVATSLVISGTIGLFLFWTSGVYDLEYLNAKIESGLHKQEYTTESCDDDGCTDTYHPPAWYVIAGTGQRVEVPQDIFEQLVVEFDNREYEYNRHLGQVSIGDGNYYHARWGEGDPIIPTSIRSEYVNLLLASDSILKKEGVAEKYDPELLLPYPEPYHGAYGEIEMMRVLEAGVDVPDDWAYSVDRALDHALVDLGYKRQVNLLVYVVASDDRGFLGALEDHWVNGKKNDAIVVIGAPNFPEVSWVGVTAWTKNELFKVQLCDKLEALDDLSDPEKVANLILTQVDTEGDAGFDRMPMSELEDLIYDIDMPLLSYVMIFVMTSLVVSFVSIIMENNTTRNRVSRFRS